MKANHGKGIPRNFSTHSYRSYMDQILVIGIARKNAACLTLSDLLCSLELRAEIIINPSCVLSVNKHFSIQWNV